MTPQGISSFWTQSIRPSKGFATLTALTLIHQMQENGDLPLWETAESNLTLRRLQISWALCLA